MPDREMRDDRHFEAALPSIRDEAARGTVKTRLRPDGAFDVYAAGVYLGRFEQPAVTPMANAITLALARVRAGEA